MFSDISFYRFRPPVDQATSPYTWNLGMNINPSDGNNYGYGASYWTGDTSYGTPAESLAKDFQDKDVRNMPANYIAIVRHNNGVCEGARVWRFTVGGNSLRHHFKTATRSIETEGGIVSEDIPTSTNRDSDPILSSVAVTWRSTGGTPTTPPVSRSMELEKAMP